ncbi:MAG TPA: hypothetical protein VEK05_10710 [Burkholderiales bacterium]|nr:hypothetical protein [Burkholderiales bacterium]
MCLVLSDEPIPGCHGQGSPENSCAERVSPEPDINHYILYVWRATYTNCSGAARNVKHDLT